METDDAGLRLVDYIRTELKNETVRIILRTGQPGPGAGAPRHRRLRHQRLQGEDRADRRQAVHRADRGAARLSAAPAHGRDPPRARDDHRGRLDAVRLQVDAAAGRGRADPARLAAQCRMRRHPGAARQRQRAGEVLRSSPAPAATGSSPARPARPRSIPTLREAVDGAFQRHAHEFQPKLSVLYVRTAQRPRGRRAAGDAAAAVRHRPLAGRGVLQPAVGRVRQRHPLRAAERRDRAAGGARPRAHPRADRRQSPADLAMDPAAPRQRVQERGARHHRPRSEEPAGRHPRPRRDAQRARRDRARSRSTRSGSSSATSAAPPRSSPAWSTTWSPTR